MSELRLLWIGDSQVFGDAEVDSARTAAEKDVAKNSDEIIQQIDRELSFLTHD